MPLILHSRKNCPLFLVFEFVGLFACTLLLYTWTWEINSMNWHSSANETSLVVLGTLITCPLASEWCCQLLAPFVAYDSPNPCLFFFKPFILYWCITGYNPVYWICWNRLRAEEEGIRGWDGWMASPLQWTWTWANFRRWWRTGKPGVLQSMGSQRVRHDWATEQQQQ